VSRAVGSFRLPRLMIPVVLALDLCRYCAGNWRRHIAAGDFLCRRRWG
jgi:hypothetical protein